ncbi:hypothetical protein [Aequorivita capsosiphonis]|uniref:hypothetical protein n=1 Tax=Aequorivita capsosiphonis TaxID=487317 RepID=UPI0003FE355D|nr:hypothetical protein [Aequorivita capsosiphonis]
MCTLLAMAPSIFFGQSNQDVYNWFDNQVGIENTSIFTGIEYIEIEKGSDGFTKFLYPNSFSTGFVSYDGQTYYDIALRFNVYDDKVIVNIGKNSSEKVFEIFAAKVDSFSIDNRKFIQNKTLVSKTDKPVPGFSELIQDSRNIRLFKKLQKGKSTKIKDRTVLFHYKWGSPKYYLLFNDKMHEVNRKKDFIEIFPQFKGELKEQKIDRKMIKNNPDSEVILLTKTINSLLNR